MRSVLLFSIISTIVFGIVHFGLDLLGTPHVFVTENTSQKAINAYLDSRYNGFESTEEIITSSNSFYLVGTNNSFSAMNYTLFGILFFFGMLIIGIVFQAIAQHYKGGLQRFLSYFGIIIALMIFQAVAQALFHHFPFIFIIEQSIFGLGIGFIISVIGAIQFKQKKRYGFR